MENYFSPTPLIKGRHSDELEKVGSRLASSGGRLKLLQSRIYLAMKLKLCEQKRS